MLVVIGPLSFSSTESKDAERDRGSSLRTMSHFASPLGRLCLCHTSHILFSEGTPRATVIVSMVHFAPLWREVQAYQTFKRL